MLFKYFVVSFVKSAFFSFVVIALYTLCFLMPIGAFSLVNTKIMVIGLGVTHALVTLIVYIYLYRFKSLTDKNKTFSKEDIQKIKEELTLEITAKENAKIQAELKAEEEYLKNLNLETQTAKAV